MTRQISAATTQEKPSSFLINFRQTIGTAVHCIACKERLRFHDGKFFHAKGTCPSLGEKQ